MRGLGGSLLRAALAGVLLAGGVLGVDVLETIGFSSCNTNASVSVQKVDIKYNNDDKTVTFDVAGTSNKIQNVTAVLNVTAYGQNIYSNSFNPCDQGTFVQQLCPVPSGSFSAKGTQIIPQEFASLVPDIAFQVPDIAAMATLQLMSSENGERVACVQSQVTNGKTASVPAVSYVAAGVAGAALVLGGVSAVGAAFAGGSAAAGGGSAAGGMGTISPSFVEVFGWFQGMAMNGMMSVNHPNVYRSFAQNFGFSAGLIPWTQLQVSIDGFRAATGGNLSENSVDFLKTATLVFPDGSSKTTGQGLLKRAFDQFAHLAARQIETSINGTADETAQQDNGAQDTVRVAVSGIQGYVQQLSIPSGNTFMTVLLIVAIIVAAIVVGILLVKVILEFWALFGSFPKALAGFREHYWGSIARAITSLILLLYGIWVLYCVFQFTQGDSWAAKVLAGVTLVLFTGILAYFCWKIWSTARKLKKVEGDVAALYEDKNIWVKYSLFYDSYRRDYWWIFVPTIIYMFAKGCIIAGADGHGMVQSVSQLVLEGVMLILLLWSRPYERRSSNIINITIQVVRVLSVACILVFVEEFGIAQTTQTVTGVVLIAVQSALTGILAILIAWNAINACIKKNPHSKRLKDLEKQQRDTLTPLDARNSLLLERSKTASSDLSSSLSFSKTGFAADDETKDTAARATSPEQYSNSNNNNNDRLSANPMFAPRAPSGGSLRPLTPNMSLPVPGQNLNPSRENLVMGAAPLGGANGNSGGGGDMRQPTLPNLGGGGGYNAPGRGGYGGFGTQQQQQQGGGYGGYNNYRGPYSRY
ncbi:putative flavin carrier protein 3 [Chaetomidium leptoderma]|uniref:Flavin carrier protein 3 n=1 Tax=Chaetomidium leptoderma TaxID=669021 RepID=A0AAN6VVI8_9PEZI|nr:putative flavin carrier protein 3 [Chaetomidium leptoderma]